MSLAAGLGAIEEGIIQISRIDALDTTRSEELFELKELFANLQTKYNDLSQYNKAVKLFEAFRMLDD